MRRADAQLFEGDTLNSVHAIDIGALATSSWEHRLAEKAFKRALGAPDPYPRTTRGEIVDMLSRDYATYGLSRGRNESAELIRRIESAAERQAQKRGRDAGRE
jgi:hypothetical protein